MDIVQIYFLYIIKGDDRSSFYNIIPTLAFFSIIMSVYTQTYKDSISVNKEVVVSHTLMRKVKRHPRIILN